jgi:hypothetical protein
MIHIVITHGTVSGQIYARADDWKDAIKLVQAAKEQGYHDAEAMTREGHYEKYGDWRFMLANHSFRWPSTRAVVVKYGNEDRERLYARTGSELGALALCKAAQERGFPARIVDAQSFREATEAQRRGEADPARAA